MKIAFIAAGRVSHFAQVFKIIKSWVPLTKWDTLMSSAGATAVLASDPYHPAPYHPAPAPYHPAPYK